MIKLALPAGDLRRPLAERLQAAGLHVGGYGEGSRSYRLRLDGADGVTVRVFREKDIPIQIALGNYDLGICNLAWVLEMQARFPRQPIVPLHDLGLGRTRLYAAAADEAFRDLGDLASRWGVRIVSEYANLAEALAMAARLPAYRVQAVWGAAEAYPPEDADLALIPAPDEAAVRAHGLRPLFLLLESSAWLIANEASLRQKDLSPLLRPLAAAGTAGGEVPRLRLPPPAPLPGRRWAPPPAERQALRIALPDGHQQRHVVDALRAAGLALEGYDESTCWQRPRAALPGLEVKVIRPHDMPQLVATGEMDLAITGRDCLREHLYRFPSSPVEEVLDLRRGQFNLCAVVSQDLPAGDIAGAVEGWRAQGRGALRIASEFPAIADHYARSRRFWRYQVIPIAGASEGFVPEDADLLIEGTETGRTLAENRLKAIDLLFRSTTCVIARRDRPFSGRRHRLFQEVVGALERAAEAAGRV